jgi:hypothetical protein
MHNKDVSSDSANRRFMEKLGGRGPPSVNNEAICQRKRVSGKIVIETGF